MTAPVSAGKVTYRDPAAPAARLKLAGPRTASNLLGPPWVATVLFPSFACESQTRTDVAGGAPGVMSWASTLPALLICTNGPNVCAGSLLA